MVGEVSYFPKSFFPLFLVKIENMTVQTVYDHVADFIAGLDPEKVLELKATEAMSDRMESLVAKKKEEGLSEEEADELNHYLVLERLIRLAKLRARIKLAA